MKFAYTPNGTCSRLIELDIENGVINDINVIGGCHGNLQGVAALCRGRRADEVAAILKGICCGNKATSCPDQIAQAIESAVNE